MRISGWRTASTFQRYNIVADDDLRDAAARLDAKRMGHRMGHSERSNDGEPTAAKPISVR
jgi:hypothetical protein